MIRRELQLSPFSRRVLTLLSEKRRIPAWCDRILWKGETLRQLEYYTAPLKFSDHRPVYAIFECIIQTIDQDMKERLSRELYEKYKETVEAALSESKYEHDTRGASARGSSAVTSLPVSSGCRTCWSESLFVHNR